jgi:hypothetical protein
MVTPKVTSEGDVITELRCQWHYMEEVVIEREPSVSTPTQRDAFYMQYSTV